MKQRLHALVILLLCFLPHFIFGQQAITPSTGVLGACGDTTGPKNQTTTSAARVIGNNTVQNGTNTIGNIYSLTKCGLNFSTASQRLGKRFSPVGVNQPAPFVISGIPACAVIERAYLWAEGSGNGAAMTATVNGPLGSANYPMAVVGNGPDKCWGYAGSKTYRADVTASVNGNGTYNISGILTNPPNAGNDMDGASLVVIWSDASQTYQGTIILDDGAMVNTVSNGSTTHIMTFPAVCGPTTGAQAFCCIGDLQFNGTTVTMNGTPGPYAWNWWNLIQAPTTVSVGQSTATFYVMSPGDCYNLCVTGLYFRTTCVACTGLALTATYTPTTCSNCNGTATVTVNPSGSYTYSWNTIPVQTTATATGLCAGTYICTVTSSCVTSTISVTVPQVGGALTLNPVVTNVLCNGACNGSVVTTVSGGTSPYTFVWSPAIGNSTAGNVNTASGLCPGTYTMNVTDASGCTGSATVTITEPPPLTATQSQVDILCSGGTGTATVNPSGGVGPYTYSWSPIGGSGQTGTGLTVGPYTCTTTDANGCTITNSFTITQPSSITIAPTIVDVACFGGTTGSASLSVSGGTPGYSYQWSSGGTGSMESNLAAGTYTCTITDANGCIVTQPVTITEPPQLTLSVAGFNVSCFNSCDGQVVVIPSGGTPNYSFSWNTGCLTPSCTNVCAGSYTVTVTDNNGCVATGSTTVTQPTAITISTSAVDAHCSQADGSATAVGGGGTGTLTYQWIGGPANANYPNISANTYSVIVTDANGCADTATATVNNLPGVIATVGPIVNASCYGICDGSISCPASGGNGPYNFAWTPNISNINSISNACAGTYTMVATDADGCTSTVTATITQPASLTITATATPTAVCVGTPVTLNAVPVGGNPALNVLWTPVSLPGNTITVTPQTSTTYTATVTDANGCTANATAAVVVNPVPVAALSGNQLSGCAPLCVNFTDNSTVTNPATIASWSWNFGDNATDITQSPSHCYMNAGVYTVTLNVTTTDGCTNIVTMTNYIDVFANPVAMFNASPQPTTILNPTINFRDSSINAASWNWSFGDLLGSSSTAQNPSFTYLDPTCYQVVLSVASSEGCTDTTSENICIGPDATIYVPNAFTPNGDGINDVFLPVGLGIDPEHYQLWIFDRWGNLIFTTTDLSKGWDGKVQGGSDLCQIDTYVWKIKALDVTGNRNNLIGRVSLIR